MFFGLKISRVLVAVILMGLSGACARSDDSLGAKSSGGGGGDSGNQTPVVALYEVNPFQAPMLVENEQYHEFVAAMNVCNSHGTSLFSKGTVGSFETIGGMIARKDPTIIATNTGSASIFEQATQYQTIKPFTQDSFSGDSEIALNQLKIIMAYNLMEATRNIAYMNEVFKKNH